VADDLAERGFSSSPLHGDMAQVAREKALAKFREDKIRVLVATDVAARGIDVRGVSHVINYTCPEDDKTDVHRIGRTGRAGASGTAVTFVDWADTTRWKVINKTLDLPFDMPQETYSTSPHIYHDLGIPEGTKGRIKPPAPQPERTRSDRPQRSDKPSGERPARNRDRSRTRSRNGATVAEGTDGTAKATATSGPVTTDSGEARPAASRNRRRRRRSSGGSGQQPAAETA
jgi:superfamily II DNA/RNA helicase